MPLGWGLEKSESRSIPLISVSSGRFPRARLQSPRHYVPAGSSARAVPAGVAALHYNQLVLTIKKKFISYPDASRAGFFLAMDKP